MKKIKLLRGGYTLVDDGDFEYLNQFRWRSDGDYVVRSIKTKRGWRSFPIHREILGLLNKEIGTTIPSVDHINHNGLDNRRCNLRVCNYAQNGMNRKPNRNAKSKYKGVIWRKERNRWVARIWLGERLKQVGSFTSEEAAALAYNQAALRYFGEFACLNKI